LAVKQRETTELFSKFRTYIPELQDTHGTQN